jgi:hypothetical protein
MGRDAKIVLLVGGLLTAALLGLVVVAAGLLGPRIARSIVSTANGPTATDPATKRRILSEIADIRIPKGFRLGHTSEVFASAQATLVSTDRRHWMRISLSREHGFAPSSVDVPFALVTDVGLRFMCANLVHLADEPFTVRGKKLVFHQILCTTKGALMHFEFGEFEGAGPQTYLLAVAPAENWDSTPVRQLLASVR